ncbi:HAD family hydrolase [Patescibacteria group bacterium]
MIKNIIFDFGGVILKHKASHNEESLAEVFSISVERARDLFNKNHYMDDIIAGKSDSRQFISQLKEELNNQADVDELLQQWKELYKKEADELNIELLEFIDSLKEKYKVYLFTNTIDIHDSYNSTRGVYEKFNQVFKSFEEGFRKPEKESYQNVLGKISAEPEECVFIDDLEENVEAAISLGLKGIVFKNLDQLKKDLAELDIEP